MNTIRVMVYSSFRGYRTGHRSTSINRSKLPGQLEIAKRPMREDVMDEDAEIADDLDAFESDFTNVAQLDKLYEKEMSLAKAKLATQIVKRKYFKSTEPAMLTWGEKEQIRLLHKEDPEEWTPEKLSESFPATTDTILKVLRSNWSVKSTSVVEKYEKRVKENWALFKAGKLDVNPQLAAHLAKFKNRKIKPMDPETIAKTIVKPKPVFPKPQSSLFSNIIQSYLDVNPASRGDEDDELPIRKSSNDKSTLKIAANESFAEHNCDQLALVTPRLASQKRVSSKDSITFDQFLQAHVGSVDKNDMTPVDRVIVDEAKRQSSEAYKNKSMVLQSDSPVGVWNQSDETEESRSKVSGGSKGSDSLLLQKNDDKDLAVTKERSQDEIEQDLRNSLEGSVETGIIARVKTNAALQENYPEFIRIPQNKYKRGATYRVDNRYYDDDGEFLYRVPGLKF